MSKFWSKTSPKGAVLYLNQFPKNFLRPYGRQEEAPNEDTVYKRIKPESCEWLLRPKVATSELADTIQKSLETLEEVSGRTLLRASSLVRFKTAFDGIQEHLPLLNTRDPGDPTTQSVKALLKFLCDDEIDNAIDEAYKIGSALFSMATHVIVARNLVRNTERFAETFSPVTPTKDEKRFKQEKTITSLKRMMTSYYTEAIVAPDGKKCGSRKRLFAEIDSDEEKDLSGSELSEQELVGTPTKPRERQSFGKEQVSNRKVTETKSTNEEENQPELEKTGKRKKRDGVITKSASSEKGLLRRATEKEQDVVTQAKVSKKKPTEEISTTGEDQQPKRKKSRKGKKSEK
jgi:hypothetical protein